MNGRQLTDAQIARALRAHLPEAAAPGLRQRVFEAAETTAQQRALPSLLGRLGDADPDARRQSLLLVAALLAALAIVGSALVGSRLLERDPLRELDLAPPADLPAFVMSAYGRMPELPPLAMTTIEDGSVKSRIYVHESGAVRIERYGSLDATEPETYEIFSGNTRAELAVVGSERVWKNQEDAISEDPRVFVYAALSANAVGALRAGCEVATSPGEVYTAPPAGGWRYVGLEYVLGRPAHHVACSRDLWIDVETRLVLRSRTPVLDDALQPVGGALRTIEVVELEFGDQPADLFDLAKPDDVAYITPEQECARVPSCSATPVPAFTPRPGATPGSYPPPPSNLPSNGWVAFVMQPGISGYGPADIYLARAGAEPRLIVGGDYQHGHNGCPSFSPDGSRLAYAEALRHVGGGAWSHLNVVVVEVDGAGSRVGRDLRLPVPGSSYSGLPCPKWSPDGSRLAYGSTGETGFATLAVTTIADGSTVVLASDDSEGRVAGPSIANWGEFAWSPDGDVLAVSEGAGGIWLVPTDGGEPSLLREGILGVPVWSPDGSRIAVTVCPGQCERDIVRILRVDGTAADLDLGPGDRPVWSPTGEQLAYVGTDGIVIVGADGADARSLPYVGEAHGDEPWRLASGVQWSPDGRQLLYIGYAGSPTYVYAPVSISAAGDAPPVMLAPPSRDLYATRDTDLSWQPVLP
jgi:Tol biopolymer transport system component